MHKTMMLGRIVCNELPRTPNGKIAAQLLRPPDCLTVFGRLVCLDMSDFFEIATPIEVDRSAYLYPYVQRAFSTCDSKTC